MNQNSGLLDSSGPEKGLLPFPTYLIMKNFALNFQYLPVPSEATIDQFEKTKKQKQTKHLCVGTWQGEVVVMKRRRWVKFQERKFRISNL